MEREFIPYELAVKLKALGFDGPCFGVYIEGHLMITYDSIYNSTDVPVVKAPTFSQAFRWFRDKNFYAKIESYHSLGNHKPFGLSIDYLHESGKWTYIDHGGDFDFQTHEEAQERAIEIIIGILEK